MAPPPIRIAFFPAGTINTASSRLRCFGLARELERLGFAVTLGVDASALPQIFFVQKVITPDVLRTAQVIRSLGGHVFFDIDDYGDAALGGLLSDPETFSQFMQLVNVVIVDTETRRQVIQQDPRFSVVPHFWVIPDPIDYVYGDLEELPPRDAPGGRKLHACWFGNAPNIAPALPYLAPLSASGRVADVNVLTNREFVDLLRQNYPGFAITPWSLEAFPAVLSGMDFCVLIHDQSLEGIQKSNNKMLASLALGVVPFVSRTPAYAETAEQMGMPELVVDSPQDVLDRLDPKAFDNLAARVAGERCRSELQKYSPAASARIFTAKLAEYVVALSA
ncbi:MAG TPA: hypothetical protein VL974_10740 [Magnetospirillum sp.]|jgi:hypothetical protein|nr:hypothetical protein [Magnetospirillum sp.]